ncbi:MAG: hypothetical protein HQM13_13295, partial [SAR324 cluster bacterium]|nr:hypothetical protein [SAR324 cluster bacterium]
MKNFIFIGCFSIAFLFVSPLFSLASKFENFSHSLEFFEDSRKVRDLKNGKGYTKTDQHAFTKSWQDNVYRPANEATVKHVESLDKYKGKKVVVHEFRTPGSDPLSVNTDSDKRVLVEVEPGRWKEVPSKDWKDAYHKEFAKRTGYQGSLDTSNPNARASMTEHAGKYRQLATDKSHVEASLDYTDQIETKGEGKNKRLVLDGTTVKVVGFNPDGTAIVESSPNILKAKGNQATLTDAEGLGKMYREKADEQYRKAEDLSKKINDPNLSPERAALLEDKMHMHETEGTMQAKKGVGTLEQLRDSYTNQGRDVGKLPPDFEKAAGLIKQIDGGASTDVAKLKSELNKLGFKNLQDFNNKLSGQIESLKLAPQAEAPPKSANLPDEKIKKKFPQTTILTKLEPGNEKAMRALGVAGKGMGVMGNIATGKQVYDALKHGDAEALAGIAYQEVKDELTYRAMERIIPGYGQVKLAADIGWEAGWKVGRVIGENVRLGFDGPTVDEAVQEKMGSMYDIVSGNRAERWEQKRIQDYQNHINEMIDEWGQELPAGMSRGDLFAFAIEQEGNDGNFYDAIQTVFDEGERQAEERKRFEEELKKAWEADQKAAEEKQKAEEAKESMISALRNNLDPEKQ